MKLAFSEDRKKIILNFRWLQVLIVTLLISTSRVGVGVGSSGYSLALFFFVTNLILLLLPRNKFDRPWLPMAIFLLDVTVISTAIYLSGGIIIDFYIVYLLTIFMAAFGENLKRSLFIAAIAGGVYAWMGFEKGLLLEDTGFIIRIPFLFLVAFFSGYLAQQVRVQKKEWEKIEQTRKDLQVRLDKATHSEELAYEKLLSLYEYNENILQSIDQGVIVVDLFGRVTVFNRGAERITGYTTQEVLENSLSDLKGFTNLHQILLNSDTDSRIVGEEIEITTLERKVIPIDISTSFLIDPHDVRTGTIVLFRDLTQVKELKERLHHSERLAVLGEMAAYVAHEIRNPLNSINGFSQLIHQKTENGDQIREYAQVILEETHRVDQTIEEILDFSRFKKPRLQLTDINQVLNDSIPSLEDKAKEHGVLISKNLDSDPPPIQADGHQLRQVFTNLLYNAIDAIDQGGEVCFKTRRVNETLRIEIEDTGKGIPEENLVQIFNPFFTTKERGTGLGLAISRKIIEDHGGTIGVQSTVGRGSTFRIDLPLTRRRDEEDSSCG